MGATCRRTAGVMVRSLSEDGLRLIEVVGFKGGRSAGFTLSRVWDKVNP
jgi:hypothetical protein